MTMLNFFVNVVYTINNDKINIVKLDYSKPSFEEYLAIKWVNNI